MGARAPSAPPPLATPLKAIAIIPCFHPEKPPMRFVNIPIATATTNVAINLRPLCPSKKNSKISCFKKYLDQNLF
jgi:hypothetical protein